MTKKMVLRVDVHDEKEKQKAMKAVSSLSGVDSLAMDMKEKKLTVIGVVDPVEVVSKLKKNWHTKILTVGPPKEPEKENKEEVDKCPELQKLYCSQYYPYYGPYFCGADEKPYICWYS